MDKQLIDLIESIDFGSADIATSEAIMKKIEYAKKQLFVKERHVTSKGKPRSINEPKNESSYWWTKLPGKILVRATTYEKLIEKLYAFYSPDDSANHDVSTSYMIRSWYDIGLSTRTHEPSTVVKHNNTVKSFLSDDFMKSDVRDVTPNDIDRIFKNAIKVKKASESSIKQLRSTLNVIFVAASDLRNNGIIPFNPVDSINIKNYFIMHANEQEDTKSTISTSNWDLDTEDDDDEFYSSFSPEEIKQIRKFCRDRITRWSNWHIRQLLPYMILFASYTGVRISELPVIKWEDINSECIKIHRMMKENKTLTGSDRWKIVPWTKNEQKKPLDKRKGRKIPLYCKELKSLVLEIHEFQVANNVDSEYVFAKLDGSLVTIADYKESLRKVCNKLELSLTNNHAFRKALNGYLEHEYNLPLATRAEMLGHSPEVNLRHYTVKHSDWIKNSNQNK